MINSDQLDIRSLANKYQEIAKALKQNYPTPSGFEVESMQVTYQSMLDRFEQTRTLMQNAGDLLALGRDLRCLELGITPPTTT